MAGVPCLGVEEVCSYAKANNPNNENDVVFPPDIFKSERIDERIEENSDDR